MFYFCLHEYMRHDDSDRHDLVMVGAQAAALFGVGHPWLALPASV
jgi:hypothetical protein